MQQQSAGNNAPRYTPQDLATRPEKLGFGALLFGLIIMVSNVFLARYGDSMVLQVAALAGGVTAITAIAAILRRRLYRRTAQEWLDFQEQQQQSTSSELFESADEAVRLAERAERVYVTVVARSLTAVLGAGIILFCLLLWRNWEFAQYKQAEDPLNVAVFALSLFVACMVFASYFIGVSREKYCRWLRPCGSWMAFSGLIMFLSAIVLLSEHAGWDINRFDVRTAKLALILFGLLGIELLFKFITEFYRPRRRGEEEVPLYESRLLGLFTEPGGVARNVATALDYQFGFKVSEVWFYRILEKTLLPLIVVAAIFFWLQTCIEIIEPAEKGIRTRFGAVVSATPLGSGIYAKLPWPFAEIRTFPVHAVQKMPIGYIPGDDDEAHSWEELPEELQGDPTAQVITWNKAHNARETNFVVPSEKDESDDAWPEGRSAESEITLPVSVYFIAASVPLYFKVDNLYKYLYRHENTNKTLHKVALREITRYLAHGDFFALLTERRQDAARIIRDHIQDAADELSLGIDVVFVGLQGLHPPVKTGEAFNQVVASYEEMHTKELEAERYEIEKKPSAQAKSTEIKTKAKIYREGETVVAKAESQRFDKQVLAYNACPEVYALRSFLELLENKTADTRKYVMAIDDVHEVNILNLEEKVRPDLLDLELDRNPNK